MTRFGRLALIMATLVAIPVAAAAQKETETVDRTIPLPSNGMLRLRNFSGDVHITGTSGRDVVIKAERRAKRAQLDHIKLDIQTSGSTVSIDANKRDADWDHHDDNVVETSFEIQVPASAKLDVHAFSSDLDVSGVTGEQTLETFSGGITVTGAKDAVEAKAFSGDIEIDATGAGASPDVSAQTFSGRIRTRLAENARGQLRFDSFSGAFDSDIPLTLRSSSRKGVSAELPGGASGATLKFHTFSGSLRVVK
jgi:DUF4097 and DUF4098 domain-containing protein YvlB